MTQPSDFKAAVASLLNSFADAANALADELVTSVTDPPQYGVSTSSGGVSPGTVSAPAATSGAGEAAPTVLPDGTPVPALEPQETNLSGDLDGEGNDVTPGAPENTETTEYGTVTPTTADDPISTSSVIAPSTTTDATDPTA